MTSTTDEERKAKSRARVERYKLKNIEKIRAAGRAYYAKNADKQRVRHRQYRIKNKDKTRQYRFLNRARIRENKTISARMRNQRRQIAFIGRAKPEVCDICGEIGGRICADHCHKLGHPRGWLCERCNLVLGKVGDDSGLLRKMIAYLKQHAVYQSPQLALPGF